MPGCGVATWTLSLSLGQHTRNKQQKKGFRRSPLLTKSQVQEDRRKAFFCYPPAFFAKLSSIVFFPSLLLLLLLLPCGNETLEIKIKATKKAWIKFLHVFFVDCRAAAVVASCLLRSPPRSQFHDPSLNFLFLFFCFDFFISFFEGKKIKSRLLKK